MIGSVQRNPYLRMPRIMHERSSCEAAPFACISEKFSEIRKAKESCAENTLNRTFRVITTPILWTNRVLRATYAVSSLKPFADFLMIVQPVLSKVISRMLLVCGAVYLVSLFRYFAMIALQTEFKTNISEYYKTPLFKLQDTSSVFEKLNALQTHVKVMFESTTDHRHTISSIDALQKILQNTSVYDMSVTLQIQKVKQAILLDALIYLKNYDQSLENRLTPWMTTKLHEELDFLITAFSTGDIDTKNYAQVRTEQLLTQVDKEAQKILIAHIMGALTVLLNISGTIASLVLSSGLSPVILFALSYLFMGIEYGIYYGCAKKEGWAFHIKDCIPDLVHQSYHHLEKKRKDLAGRVHIDLHATWKHLSCKIYFDKSHIDLDATWKHLSSRIHLKTA